MMEQERLSELYGQMCRKAARNAQKIGSDLREFLETYDISEADVTTEY